jgi:hypothetical protein
MPRARPNAGQRSTSARTARSAFRIAGRSTRRNDVARLACSWSGPHRSVERNHHTADVDALNLGGNVAMTMCFRALPGAGEADVVSDGVVAVARRALLPFVVVALLVGVVASFVGAHDLAVAVWSLASGVVAADLVVVTIARLREGRVAVDVVALVALLASMVPEPCHSSSSSG